ncbi:HD domain-containing protein [Spongiimicrobium salis]|uniref:HD domain-containing protein n=1 Tax=Spongiimicrobium salis TaxID=1667022 RepID=UPI00374D0B08
MDLNRWLALMDVFGFSENQSVFKELLALYSEKHRAYHNTTHINDCLQQLDAITSFLPFKKEMELALWFHDCIYNPYGKDNELKSAEKAKQFLLSQQAKPETIRCIWDMIMTTLHNGIPKNDAEALLVDIDLSILGSESAVYESYTAKIREEYKSVPGFLYRKKRKEILHLFLKKKRIYHTAIYYEGMEVRARNNISAEIMLLSK